MDASFQSPSNHGTRVFRGACAVLVLVALAQGAAVAVAWKDRSWVTSLPVTQVPDPGETAVAAKPEPVAADPFQAGTVLTDDPHPELALPAGEAPLGPDPAEPVLSRPPVVVAAPLDVPITDEACLGHLDEGIYLRDRGDMVGAVRELRKALALAPEHPRLLYQLSSALDSMGQERKAAEHWRQLRLLGQGAGNYYQLAVGRLKEGGNLPPSPHAPPEPEDEEKAGNLVVSQLKAERMADTAQGEVWHISARIERKGSGPVEVPQVAVKLHLFDEVNGQRIDRFYGEEPPNSWLDLPVDWTEGSERVLFVVNRPPLSPDELVRLGQRKHYGQALEIRYGTNPVFTENQLEDLAAEPAFLAGLAREIPESAPLELNPAGGEWFDPAMPAMLPEQSGALLFPGDKFDR